MIPVGAGIRMYRGFKKKHQLEERIELLEDLCSTPAISHYSGLQRFDVAAALADAKLGLLLSKEAPVDQRKAESQAILQFLKGEFEVVAEAASQNPATKAEVFALGLAVREVALSLDDAVAAFRETSDGCLTSIKERGETEIRELNRTRSDLEQANATNQARCDQMLQKVHEGIQLWQAVTRDQLDQAFRSEEAKLETSLASVNQAIAESPAGLRSDLDALRASVSSTITWLKWTCSGLFVGLCVLAVCGFVLLGAR
jgi:hypothetical protein